MEQNRAKMDKRMKACCFTGHRMISNERITYIQRKLEETIGDLIQRGVVFFSAGGALGFDTLAAKVVLKARETNQEVKLILVLPCVSQADRWNEEDRAVYEEIKGLADEIIYTSQEYRKGCMHKRNRYLVDNSSICICYLTENTGGTAYTVRYAKRKRLSVINIAETENSEITLIDCLPKL